MNEELHKQDAPVAIVEDHEDLRNSLSLILRSMPGFTLTGAYGSCEELLDTLETTNPQVVLMDIGLPGMSGIEGVRRIKERRGEIQMLMLTIYEDDDRVFEAICAGAGGYLLKRSSPAEILKAIEDVMHGGVPMTPSIAQKVIKTFRNILPRPSEKVDLTPREYEILRSLADGLGYKQIAARHFISVDTVRGHIRHLYEKLQVHTKSEAVAKALRHHIV